MAWYILYIKMKPLVTCQNKYFQMIVYIPAIFGVTAP